MVEFQKLQNSYTSTPPIIFDIVVVVDVVIVVFKVSIVAFL